MHLAKGLTTTRTSRKKKTKHTKAQIEKWTEDMRVHNKRMKRSNCHDMVFKKLDQFIDYIHGRGGVPVARRCPKPQDEVRLLAPTPYRRTTPNYPSYVSTRSQVAAKKQSPRYTGTNMIGIGQLHKSNSVPVFRKQEAEDIAKMRRN